jgi:hypothetical protein
MHNLSIAITIKIDFRTWTERRDDVVGVALPGASVREVFAAVYNGGDVDYSAPSEASRDEGEVGGMMRREAVLREMRRMVGKCIVS